jgi:hypothetical protein
MPLREKALEMRNAIDGIELALHGNNKITDTARLFDDAEDDLVVKVAMTAGNLRQICTALDECNRIIHSPEFIPANLAE